MSSFAYAFLKFGLFRDNTHIRAVKSISRNLHANLRFGEALGYPCERHVRYKFRVHKTRLCKIRGKYRKHFFYKLETNQIHVEHKQRRGATD